MQNCSISVSGINLTEEHPVKNEYGICETENIIKTMEVNIMAKLKKKKKIIKLDCLFNEEGYQEFHTKFVKKQKRKSRETLYVIYWRYGNWKHQFCGVTNNFDQWLEEYNKERISIGEEPESAFFFSVLEVPTTLFVESKKPNKWCGIEKTSDPCTFEFV